MWKRQNDGPAVEPDKTGHDGGHVAGGMTGGVAGRGRRGVALAAVGLVAATSLLGGCGSS